MGGTWLGHMTAISTDGRHNPWVGFDCPSVLMGGITHPCASHLTAMAVMREAPMGGSLMTAMAVMREAPMCLGHTDCQSVGGKHMGGSLMTAMAVMREAPMCLTHTDVSHNPPMCLPSVLMGGITHGWGYDCHQY